MEEPPDTYLDLKYVFSICFVVVYDITVCVRVYVHIYIYARA